MIVYIGQARQTETTGNIHNLRARRLSTRHVFDQASFNDDVGVVYYLIRRRIQERTAMDGNLGQGLLSLLAGANGS